MNTKLQLVSIVLLLAGGAAAYAADAPAEEEEVVQKSTYAIIADNGMSLNGIEMNGIEMNGIEMNGIEMNGIEMNGTLLTGVRADTGQVVSGVGFMGTTMTGVLSNGAEISLYVAKIEPSSDPDIWLYTVLIWNGASWVSLCGDSALGPIQAIPLEGRWDYSQGTPTGGDHIDDPGSLTFGCMGAALAKCAMFGYKPWETVEECTGSQCVDVPLRPLHQACTRMVRGDYCGDGQPHTVDGTPIDLWDSFGVQAPASPSTKQGMKWTKEAEWSAEGAVCVSKERLHTTEAAAYINAHCPERRNASFACFGAASTFHTPNAHATPLASRSLLRNEFEDGPLQPSLSRHSGD